MKKILLDKYITLVRRRMQQKGMHPTFIEEFIDNYEDQLQSMVETTIKEKRCSREVAEQDILTRCESVENLLRRVQEEYPQTPRGGIGRFSVDPLIFRFVEMGGYYGRRYQETVLSTTFGLAINVFMVWLLGGGLIVTLFTPWFIGGYGFPNGIAFYLTLIDGVVFFPIFAGLCVWLGRRVPFTKGASIILVSAWAITLVHVWDFIQSIMEFLVMARIPITPYIYDIQGYTRSDHPLRYLSLGEAFYTVFLLQFVFFILWLGLGFFIYGLEKILMNRRHGEQEGSSE